MKKIPLTALAAFLSGISLGYAAEEPQSVPQQPTAETSAHILGEIPDGTPPPPEPPQPKYLVPPQDVLETTTHEQGGRTITVRKINPIALPPKANTAPPVDINDPAIQERIAEAREKSSADEFLCIGATVFRPKDSAPLSQVQIWPQGKGEAVTFWSSADFGLLSGVGAFVGSDGATRSLLLMWSASEIETRDSLQPDLGPDTPSIPVFPTGKATFAITSGAPTPQTLASVQALHDIYNNEHDRLATAYEGRQRAQLQLEAELKANPPQPKNITLDYWRIERPAPAQGGAR